MGPPFLFEANTSESAALALVVSDDKDFEMLGAHVVLGCSSYSLQNSGFVS